MKPQQDLRAQFRRFDADGDGRIDWTEFRNLLTRLGLRRPEPVMQQVFRSVDENGDGFISYREFEAWWAAVDG